VEEGVSLKLDKIAVGAAREGQMIMGKDPRTAPIFHFKERWRKIGKKRHEGENENKTK